MILLNKTNNMDYLQKAIFAKMDILNSDKELIKSQLLTVQAEFKLLLLFAEKLRKKTELKRGIKKWENE